MWLELLKECYRAWDQEEGPMCSVNDEVVKVLPDDSSKDGYRLLIKWHRF